jgi:hypothetical protein
MKDADAALAARRRCNDYGRMFNMPVQLTRLQFRLRHIIARSLGIAAAAAMMTAAIPSARALSLATPSGAATKQIRDAQITEVQHRGGGGGFHGGGFHGGGGGFHGGGFRGGAPAFHGGGGGFRAAAPAFRGGGFHGGRPAFAGGGFRRGPAFHGGAYRFAAPLIARRHFGGYHGGYRHHFRPRYFGYAPSYYGGPRYYHPRRFCRVVWTYYGPRKICRYRPWHRHHWHHRHYRAYW